MLTISKSDVKAMMSVDLLAELHQIREKIAFFQRKYNAPLSEIENRAVQGGEDFALDDDLLEWKAYTRMEEDRVHTLEEIRHERFSVA